jgi:uncharacterized protein
MYRDWMYHGGIPIQGFLSSWLFGSILMQHESNGIDFHVGQKDQFVYDILSHPFDDEWHRTRSPFWELEEIEIPVFSIGAWGKAALHLRGNFSGYERVENSVMDMPAVRFFVNGEQAYHASDTWPPTDATPTTWYLSGDRSGAVTSLNDGSLTETPSDGDASTSWSYPDPQWQAGVTIFDKTGRPDHVARVNTFTTAPMDRHREFTGQGVVTMYASTDQTDMDIVAKLSLITAGADANMATKVSQGWLRASHRAADADLTEDMRPFLRHDAAEPLEPGVIYELRFELLPMAFLAKTGDRIRLEISNYDSLIADVPMTHFYGQKVGTDTYYHAGEHASCIRLHERPQ